MDEKIEKAIEKILNMYEKIENDLLIEIASHFLINDEFLNSDNWRIKKLEEMGLFNQDIIDYITRATKSTPKKVKEALNQINVDTTNMNNLNHLFEDEVLKINPNILINNFTINNIIDKSYDELSNTLIQMSNKIETSVRSAYLNIIEDVYLKTSMGTHSYQSAIREAINNLSNTGLKVLSYKTTDEAGNVTGIRNYNIESAVRREVLTASRQLSNKISMEIANELECEYIYLSEHLQCRPTHFDWQGTIIKREDLEKVTHYGEIDGLAGINCRHYFEPYFGDARGNDLKEYSEEECNKAYNLSQKQRYFENGVRKWKRKANMFNALKDKESLNKCNYKVAEWQNKLSKFTDKRDYTREYVAGYKQVNINLKPTKDNIKILNEVGIKSDNSLGRINQRLLKRNVKQINTLAKKYKMEDFYFGMDATYYAPNEDYIGAIGYDKEMTELSINSSTKYFKDKKTLIDIQKQTAATNWSMPCKTENYDIYAMTHEFGHSLEIKLYKDEYPFGISDDYIDFCRKIKNDIINIAKERNPSFDYDISISDYGRRNAKEFFAEVFANMELGSPNELGNAMEIYFKRNGVLK